MMDDGYDDDVFVCAFLREKEDEKFQIENSGLV